MLLSVWKTLTSQSVSFQTKYSLEFESFVSPTNLVFVYITFLISSKFWKWTMWRKFDWTFELLDSKQKYYIEKRKLSHDTLRRFGNLSYKCHRLKIAVDTLGSSKSWTKCLILEMFWLFDWLMDYLEKKQPKLLDFL